MNNEDSDTLLTALYVKVDDELGDTRWLGRPPQLTDSELVCPAVAQSMLGFASESRWLRFVRSRLGAMFPCVPKQPGWNKRLRAALPLIKQAIRLLAADTDASRPWSDPASDLIADELRWIQYLDDIGTPEPDLVITSRKAFSYLAANNAYRAAYYGSVNPSTTPTATLTPQQINVVRGNYSLPPIQFYKAQVRVDGKPRKVLPEDLWILVPPEREKWAQTMYGVTAEALVLSRAEPGDHPRGRSRPDHHAWCAG
ncbi:major capsid protein [Streptomyces sp. NPDC048156]|uniref:major capsid protein n=1 Tax=Streptomyces sp. NPDC048156 TaxID=3365502 RepID=UPI0037157EAA